MRRGIAVALVTASVGLSALGVVGYGPARGLFHRSTSAAAHRGVVRVELIPIPEGPVGPGFERTPPTENSKPLSLIQRFIPDPLPAPLAQAFCGGGGDLVVTFADGQQLTYGPCHRPAAIDHLWAEMIYVLDDGKCSPRCGPGGAPGP
jgi:hypothetical protein